MAFVKDIDSAVSALTQQVEILKKKADDAMPSPMKMEKMPSLTSRTYSTASGWKVASYYNGREPNTTEEVDKILKDALESIETDMKRIEEVHEKNKPAIENNKQIRERVELIMKGVLGIPDTYRTYEYKTKRSSKPTEVSHRAGYIGDLERNIPIHDGYEDAKES